MADSRVPLFVRCPLCHRNTRITMKGLLWTHRSSDQRCPGSGLSWQEAEPITVPLTPTHVVEADPEEEMVEWIDYRDVEVVKAEIRRQIMTEIRTKIGMEVYTRVKEVHRLWMQSEDGARQKLNQMQSCPHCSALTYDLPAHSKSHTRVSRMHETVVCLWGKKEIESEPADSSIPEGRS